MRPRRIVEDDQDGFEAELLRTALGEEPPRGAIRRAEAALGIGAGLGLSAKATAAAKTASAHLAAAQGATQVGALSLAKWVGIGVVSGLVVTGGARYAADPMLRGMVSTRSTVTTSAPAHQYAQGSRVTPGISTPAAAERVPSAPLAEASSMVPEPTSADLATAPSRLPVQGTRDALAPSAGRERSRSPANELSGAASLGRELFIIENARHALVAQQPDVVLRELQVYQNTRSTAVFLPEAEMLAIEALLQQGDVIAARSRAARSLDRAPNGPHAARLRVIAAQRP
jgi:hypothetical protein